jgi:hypothetical protein
MPADFFTLSTMDGKREAERAPDAAAAFRPDPPVVSLHDAFRDVETEADTAAIARVDLKKALGTPLPSDRRECRHPCR